MTKNIAESINKGISSLQSNQFEEAEKQFQHALSLQPENIDALHLLGVLKLMQGQTAAGEDFLRAAIGQCRLSLQTNPANSQLNLLLASIYLDLQKLPEAELSFRACLKVNPENADAYNGLGGIYFKQGKIQKAYSMFYQCLKKDSNNVEAWYNQGIVLRGLGQLPEAEVSLKKAVTLAPQHLAAQGCLGLTMQELGKHEDAARVYEGILTIDSTDSFASHMLSAIRGNTSPKAPDKFVTELFDVYASAYDKHLVETLQFQAPEVVVAALDEHCSALLPFDEVLDLGCGTGLMAEKMTGKVGIIDGVDLAEQMLIIANNKALYRSLHHNEIDEFLRDTDHVYDCCIASDVFIYSGDLQATFLAVNKSLKDNGVFAFTTESHGGEGYILRNSGRYAHSSVYIEKIAKASSFTLSFQKDIQLRKEEGSWLEGCVYILEKI